MAHQEYMAALKREVMRFSLGPRNTLPAYVVAAGDKLKLAEEAQQCASAEVDRCTAKLADLEQQKAATEIAVQSDFDTNGEISPETLAKDMTIARSIKAAAKKLAIAQEVLDAAVTNVAVLKGTFERANRYWLLNDEQGPSVHTNNLIKTFLEVLPLAAAESMRTYKKAHKEYGWNPGGASMGDWYGPGGSLIEVLRSIRWPDWPASVRPDWVPKAGAAASFDSIIDEYCETAMTYLGVELPPEEEALDGQS